MNEAEKQETKQDYKVSYFPELRARVVAELEIRKIPYTPAKRNYHSFLIHVSPERADELRGLEGMMSIIRIGKREERELYS